MANESPDSFTLGQQDVIIELGRRGSGGSFDIAVMCELLSAGIIDIRSRDRRIVLTGLGCQAYERLTNELPCSS